MRVLCDHVIYIKSVCSTSVHTCSKHLLLGQTVKKTHSTHSIKAITGHYSMCTQTGIDGLLISLPPTAICSCQYRAAHIKSGTNQQLQTSFYYVLSQCLQIVQFIHKHILDGVPYLSPTPSLDGVPYLSPSPTSLTTHCNFTPPRPLYRTRWVV